MGTNFRNLVELYESSVDRYADNQLFGTRHTEGWRWITYGEFGKQVDHARGGLAGLGIESGDRVAVISDNRVEWAIGAYATYGLGAAWVPMYEAQLAKEWEFILGNSGAKIAIVGDDGIRAQLDDLRKDLPELGQIVVIRGEAGGDSISWAEMQARGADNPIDTVEPASEDLACLIYTSGTTGQPKGVMLSHGNITSNVNVFPDMFDIGPDDRTASFLPWAHSFGQTIDLHFMIGAGASAGLTSAQTLMDDLADLKPTILVSVPAVYNRLYDALQKMMAAKGGVTRTLFDRALANEQKRAGLAADGKTTRWVEMQHDMYDKLVFSKVRNGFGGQLRYSISGGAAISVEVAEFISALGLTVYEGYGLTETSPVAAANTPSYRKVGSIGKEIPGVTIDIDRELTDDPEIGELIIHGPNVMLGYFNLPEENERRSPPTVASAPVTSAIATTMGSCSSGDASRSNTSSRTANTSCRHPLRSNSNCPAMSRTSWCTESSDRTTWPSSSQTWTRSRSGRPTTVSAISPARLCSRATRSLICTNARLTVCPVQSRGTSRCAGSCSRTRSSRPRTGCSLRA